MNTCQGLVAGERCPRRAEDRPGTQGDRFRFAEVVQKRLLVPRGCKVVNGCHHLPRVSRDRKQSLAPGPPSQGRGPSAARRDLQNLQLGIIVTPTWANLVRKSELPALKLRVVNR